MQIIVFYVTFGFYGILNNSLVFIYMCVSGNAVELSNFSSIYQNVLRYNLLFIILNILNIILKYVMDI